MKIPLTILLLQLWMSIAVAAENITVEISGIKDQLGGNLMVLIFGDQGFPIKHEKALLTQTKKVTHEAMTFVFEAPSENYLAFKVLHDEDSNHKVTKNWTKLWPREGLGFSNDLKMGTFGPPVFEAAKITRALALQGIKLKVVYP